MTQPSAVRLGVVFPDLLGTYGDRGNGVILRDRLARRGIAVDLVTINAGDAVPASLDCYLLGGGEDRAEQVAAPLLRASPLVSAWERGASIVAVCAGFQLLGTDIDLGSGSPVAGIGLIEATTRPAAERFVGEVVIDVDEPLVGPVSGFENHRGATTVHDHRALGVVRADGRAEGILEPRLLATYLHGPVLARNPRLADHVLSWTTGPLSDVPVDDFADALHEARLVRASTQRGLRGFLARSRLRRSARC
jgi:CobQ-like glutamine amidotransferase family enzyme